LQGEASGLPPATIVADGALAGTTVSLTAHLDAGNTAHVKLDGTIPLQAAAGFNLTTTGMIDLAVFDPVLAANGRRLRGQVSLDGRIMGTFSAPRASGTALLSGGEFDDFVQGVRVTNVSAHLTAAGDTITISDLSGRAGRGTISGQGTIALWARGIPLDLDIALSKARPVATDLFTADLDAKLKLAGRLDETLTLSGTAHIDHGDINIAESYPAQVAVLDVRRSRNAPPPPTPPKPLSVNLDLVVSAPNGITVRGRGLDAEAGGTLTVKGSSTAPIVEGGFTMRRGELSLGGSIVRFTSGKISFDGRSLSGSFDPALDFTAESTSGSVAAKLAIGGHASAPVIALTSTPSLPQDEVLAHLLFGRSIAQLNALQLAQIAQAFAALGGFGGGFNPLGSLRRTLGLDRLAVGSAASGNGATIEVGKNLGHSVYVGAKQDTGGGSQAIVQVDLTEHLKLQTTVTAVPSAAPTVPTATPQENGNSVGLTYEFEY
jgi:translocation and assembly module TamB